MERPVPKPRTMVSPKEAVRPAPPPPTAAVPPGSAPLTTFAAPLPTPAVPPLPSTAPIPLPRTKLPTNTDKVTASDILRSISTVSKQITEDVATKVSNSARTANEKFEKSLADGSKFARGTLEKTISTSRAMRDSVTKSVIQSTKSAGVKLRKSKKTEVCETSIADRCMSLPAADTSLFDNIQFHSPMLEQKRYKNDKPQSPSEFVSLNLNSPHFDEYALYSNNSDSATDTVSNFSHDSHDLDSSTLSYNNNDDDSLSMYDTPKHSRSNSIVGSQSLPDVPQRRKKREKSVRQYAATTYENWTLPMFPKREDETPGPQTTETNTLPDYRLSYNTIHEFDPLATSADEPRYEGISNELLLLESFLTADTYGTIVATDYHDDNFDEYRDPDYYNPPTPPERFDSLMTDEREQPVAVSSDRTSNWYVTTDDIPVEDDVKPVDSMISRFSKKLKLDNMKLKPKATVAAKTVVVERPPINTLPVPYYSGTLHRTAGQPMEDMFKTSQSRYCVLSDQKLMCYSDPTNGILREAHPLDTILCLQIVLPLSSSTTNNAYCFEVMVTNGPVRAAPRKIVFTCPSVAERRNWAQKIAEHLTSGFDSTYCAEYTRLGWCYLKEGVTGEWCGAWLMLNRRVLVYYTKLEAVRVIDLRKTRCVTTQEADEAACARCPSDGSPNLLLDCPNMTLYLSFSHEKLLKGWRYMIKLAATNNGAYIHHQQLTKEDVPVIVEKCLSFIYAHGSVSEGIYRRAGGNGTLACLLAQFRKDAWAVQLSVAHHSEHDVAGVLKRFLRDLPHSLLPREHNDNLLRILEIDDEGRRVSEYRTALEGLPLVARNTARKLFAHLHFLHTMAHANKMTADNLAAVWAPTIMPAATTSNTVQSAWSSKEVFVVRDLIANYEAIWKPNEIEKRREAAIRRVLIRVLSNAAPSAPKAAGDLRVWIYIHDRATCHQVALSPNKTCSDICIELCAKANRDSHLLMLEEVICNESMRRIVHVEEIVLEVVLRWGYWDEQDRKDNYLVLKDNSILYEMDPLRNQVALVCGELKIATDSTKAYKLHMFELQNGRLSCFKDKQGSHKIEEWNLKDILWYIGHEPKRNPQSRWAITFIARNKQKRSKDNPWFGLTIAGAVTEDRLKWMAAIMFAQHTDILPTPRLVIT